MIPEIVDDGKTGLVIDDTPENIARAIEKLAADRALCLEMGRQGREKALRLYDIRRHAETVLAAYRAVLS
jgi:glycosyltransferase involved in cell wall biosynthesis